MGCHRSGFHCTRPRGDRHLAHTNRGTRAIRQAVRRRGLAVVPLGVEFRRSAVVHTPPWVHTSARLRASVESRLCAGVREDERVRYGITDANSRWVHRIGGRRQERVKGTGGRDFLRPLFSLQSHSCRLKLHLKWVWHTAAAPLEMDSEATIKRTVCTSSAQGNRRPHVNSPVVI